MPFISVLQNVNTELVCEQRFSWLSRFADITKHMNRWRFLSNAVHIRLSQ